VTAGFVQIIGFKTSRIGEVRAALEELRDQVGADSGPLRGAMTADRDRPGYYLNVVEFESHELAMENSARPEISQFAARMAVLCDEPPRFYNLDLVDTWERQSGGPSMKAVVAGAATAAAGVAAAAAVKSRSGGESTEVSGQEMPETDYTAVPASEPVTVTTAEESAPAGPIADPVDYPNTHDKPL
jgi:quinol monooxygenase YgiN